MMFTLGDTPCQLPVLSGLHKLPCFIGQRRLELPPGLEQQQDICDLLVLDLTGAGGTDYSLVAVIHLQCRKQLKTGNLSGLFCVSPASPPTSTASASGNESTSSQS